MIPQAIFDYLKLKQTRKFYTCPCPFHEERTGLPFIINFDDGNFYCFACNAAGNIKDYELAVETKTILKPKDFKPYREGAVNEHSNIGRQSGESPEDNADGENNHC